MQPYGSHGMIRSWDQNVWYPDYTEIADTHYRITEKQKGPRGRLPICPDTCFVTGGAYPSNGLPDDTGPQGEGLDYYDLFKGDTIAGSREPDAGTELSEQSGNVFNAHTSDVLSADVKWYTLSGSNYCVFVAANRHAYSYSDDASPVLAWNVDIAATMLSAVPLSTGADTHVQRSYRIDPKRSLVANNKFYLLVSLCDWEIRPGKTVTFSSDPALKSAGTTVNPDPYSHYPASNDDGSITGYDAQDRTMPALEEDHVTHSVIVDDSVRILLYAHYLLPINLTGTTRTATPIVVHTEYLCGDMSLVIQPQEREQGVYFKGKEAVHNYAMEAETYALIFPDGVYASVTHTPHPSGDTSTAASQCASTLGVDISSVGLTLPVEPTWVSAHPSPPPPYASDNFICTIGYYSYLADHYHVANNTPGYEYGFAERGGAKGTAYAWTDEPDDNDFAWASPANLLDLSSGAGDAGATQWLSDGTITIPTNQQVADELYEIDPETTLYEYPWGDNITVNMLSEGNWEYLQGNYSTCWTRYDANYYDFYIVTPSIGGWSDYEDYYEPGNTKLYKYKPVPYEETRWVRGKELVATGVYNNCLSTDSAFSDLSTYTVTESGQSVTRIAMLRWGARSTPFSAATVTDDPPNTHSEIAPHEAAATQAQKNNNPCVHRLARTANKCNLTVINTSTGAVTSTEIPIAAAALTYGEWIQDSTYGWHAYDTYDLHSHNEVRPKSVWDESENRKTSTTNEAMGIQSADCHVQGQEAYASYSTTCILGTGTGSTGRHQQLVIPIKRGGALGSAFFVSCLGMLDGNVRYSNWNQGVGDAPWCDSIRNGMQVNKYVSGWALVSSAGAILTYMPEGGQTAGTFGNEWFCRWATSIELTVAGVAKEYVIVGVQYADYHSDGGATPTVTETYKFKIYGVDTADGSVTAIVGETTGILATGHALVPKTSAAGDARVYYSYSNDSGNTVASQCLLSVAAVTASNGPHDQLIIEVDSGTRHLFGLKAGSALEVLDTADLSVKKTIATTMQSISSGALNRLVGRVDTCTAPSVSTALTMEKYTV